MIQKIRKKITFYGQVQGVGFRYHAYHSAELLGLTGWVRNEYDGSVQMEIQGEESQIDRMIQMLDSDRYIEITDMNVKNLAVNEDESSFRIIS